MIYGACPVCGEPRTLHSKVKGRVNRTCGRRQCLGQLGGVAGRGTKMPYAGTERAIRMGRSLSAHYARKRER